MAANAAAAQSILNGLRSIAQVAPLPQPVIILAILETVVQTISDAKNVSDDLNRLAVRLAESAQVVIPALSSENTPRHPLLLTSASRLVSAIEALNVGVQRLLSKGKVQKFFSGPGTRLAVKQAESDFEYAVELFIVQLRAANLIRSSTTLQPVDTAKLKKAIEDAQREQLEFIEKQVAQAAPPKPSLVQQILPIHSSIFSGREAEVEHVIPLLTDSKPGYVAILGPGGIGKTALALSVINDPRVTAHYSRCRYFLACEAVPNAEALSELFARTVGVGQGYPIKAFKQLAEELSQPILITLDNLETSWELRDSREKVEKFLGELASVPQVSVLATLRGAERPFGLAWSRPVLPPLQPVNERAAVEIFTSISDVNEQDPYILPLLQAVDMVPLAITLLATQGQYITCEELLQRWNAQKTDMVTRGYPGRLSSLDVSIDVSLQSSRFLENPSSKRLLQFLSLLPDGASEALILAIAGKDFPIDTALMNLVRTSLAYRAEEDKVRTLSPIREHVLKYHPISDADLKLVFEYFYQFLDMYHKNIGTAIAREMSTHAIPLLGNMRSVISHCLAVPDVVGAERAIRATWMSFVLHTFQSNQAPTVGLLEKGAALAAERGLKTQEAYCLHNFAVAKMEPEKYDRPLQLFKETECHDGVLNSARGKALILSALARTAEALEACREADWVDMSLVSKRAAALFLHEYGKVLGSMGQPVKSLHMIRQALKMAEEGQILDASAHIRSPVSAIEGQRGAYTVALRHAELALQYSVNPETFMGIALLHIALALLDQCMVPEGEHSVNLSIQVFEHVGQKPWRTTSQGTLARLRMYQGRFEEAAALYKSVASVWGEHVQLDRLYMRMDIEQGNYESAEQRIPEIRKKQMKAGNIGGYQLVLDTGELLMRTRREAEALSNFVLLAIVESSKNTYRLSFSMDLLRLGDVFWMGYGDMETAGACYHAALDTIKYIGTPRHQGDCLIRIGLVEQRTSRPEVARSKFTYAKELFHRSYFPAGVRYCEDILLPACQDSTAILKVSDLPPPNNLGLYY